MCVAKKFKNFDSGKKYFFDFHPDFKMKKDFSDYKEATYKKVWLKFDRDGQILWLQEAVDNLGFKIMDKGMMFSKDYRFKWTQTSMEINYLDFQEGK